MSEMHQHSSTARTILTTPRPALAPLNTLERINLVTQALRDPQISRPAVLCLVALNGHYNATEGASRPSQAALAREVGSTRQRVNIYLRELAEAGYIRAQRGRYGNRYRLCPPAPRHSLAIVPGVTLPATSEPLPDVTLPVTSQASDVTLPVTPDVTPPVTQTGSIEQGVNRNTDTTPDRKRERAAKKPPAPKKHRLPTDWQPTATMVTWALSELKIPQPVLDQQIANFLAYFLDHPEITRPGWVRSWETWMRNAQKGGIRDAVTPWERAQRGGFKSNGAGQPLDLMVPKRGADFGYGTYGKQT